MGNKIMNVLSMFKTLNGAWSIKGEPQKFTASDLANITLAVIKDSSEGFGKYISLTYTSGQYGVMSLSRDCKELAVGYVLSNEELMAGTVITLTRAGDADIYKFELK